MKHEENSTIQNSMRKEIQRWKQNRQKRRTKEKENEKSGIYEKDD